MFKFVISILMIGYFSSCNSSSEAPKEPSVPGYEIQIEIGKTSMDSAFLYVFKDFNWVLIDSVSGDSGKFHFTGHVDGADFFSFGDRKRNYIVNFFAENSPIQITGNFEKPGQEKISGSAVHNEYLSIQDSMLIFDNQMNSIYQQYNMAEEQGDSVLMKQLEQQYFAFSGIKDKWLLDWVKSHPKSYVAEFYIANKLMYDVTTEELRILFDNISPEIEKTALYSMIEGKLLKLENSAVGKPAPDFTMNNTEGIPESLSSHFGSYLLIDFWASWCGPCRADSEKMVAIYHKYHDNGYNVLGVSLDSKKENWLQAIQEDSLEWDHVSDLKLWDNAASNLYGVSAIPHTVLIDPNGQIIARGLTVEELDEKLNEILNSNS
ncbi:AhpC/TSA family protein [bacterium SCSIO 12643]|nr:AhpC/TSA family protein [bacterium SCSIO 12643]